MFDLLKKKISGFAEKILGNAEKKNENILTQHEETISQPVETEKKELTKVNEPLPASESVEVVPAEEKEARPTSAPVLSSDAGTHATPTLEEGLPAIQQRNEREIKARVGIAQKIGGFFTGSVMLNEEMVAQFLEEFELSLLEADVELSTATALIEELRTRLTNKRISSRENANEVILAEIKQALLEIVHVDELDLDAEIGRNHPCVVLILGPNGAGKTTTIAKLAHRYTKMGKKVVLASADTFRAGSIEQLQAHASKIGVRMVRHQYGADPAAVAFDAVQAAKAENADMVLIDSAGRQDTNKNLLEELKKIQRVIQPHVKLYVGESYTGQAILTQARTFDEAIGIDGFILTKLDTDTKGGGVISILHNLKKPIVFFGIGQGYEDLARFSMDEFLNRLIPASDE